MGCSALLADSSWRTSNPVVSHFTVYESWKSLLTTATTVRFWGWSENKREEALDREELTMRAQQGLPLYGESAQPEWIQGAAYRNSVFSQLKFGE